MGPNPATLVAALVALATCAACGSDPGAASPGGHTPPAPTTTPQDGPRRCGPSRGVRPCDIAVKHRTGPEVSAASRGNAWKHVLVVDDGQML
jgi:hypothetical protein